MVASLAALAEPHRFQIVELLRTGPHSVNDIGERLRLNQPQVSKHLRVLKEAGLVEVRPLAQQRHYELRAEPFRQFYEWIDGYRELWEARFEEIDRIVETLREAKQRKTRRKKRGEK